MRTARKRLLPAVLAIVFALAPCTAAAEEAGDGVVPPENSAANQYTEAFPTAGGEKDVHKHKGRDTSPGKALGTATARKLEREGRAGREVAELATETAPTVEAPAPAVEPTDSVTDEERRSEANAALGGSGGGKAGGDRNATGGPATPVRPPVELPEADGSSGFGSVIASALGASPDGDTGLLLLMFATVGWAIAYASRQRRAAD